MGGSLFYLPLRGKGDRYPLWVVVDEVFGGRMLHMLKDTSSVAPRQLPLKGKPKFRKLSLIV